MNIMKMPNLAKIRHGFITGSNISFSVNDNEDIVRQNRIKIREEIGSDIIILKQDHTNKIIEVTKENKDLLIKGYRNIEYEIGDGIFTKLANTPIAVYVGDCAAVFIYSEDIKAIGIVHSGWKGTFGGINEKMLEKFFLEKADLSKLVVAIGPSIAVNNYQISDDFYQKFIAQDPASDRFFLNKNYYNNAEYIASKYQKFGVKHIYISPEDTYTDPRLFSHRYYTHFNKKNGRMIGFITI